MLTLITDRTQANVNRLNELHAKGWDNLTDAEKAEWTGDPEAALGAVNLIPHGATYSTTVDAAWGFDSITVTATQEGTYLYTVLVLGDAAKFTNQTFTLSVGGIEKSGSATPQILAYWYDSNGGFSYAGGTLSQPVPFSSTFTTDDNPNGRESFVLFLYAATSETASTGDWVRYRQLMLERGSERHDYVPYAEIVPTMATKGAYNYTDLNRVERAVEDLCHRLSISLETKTNWTMWDIPTKADMDRYLNNIATLRTYFPITPESPPLPRSMEKLTYSSANNIEKILLEIDTLISSIFRCGDLYCGEV